MRFGRAFPLSVLVVLAVFAAASAAAQQHQNNQRGAGTGPLYRTDGLDVVNLFNGNLTLAVPLGPTSTSNGKVTYGITLSYNSTVWEFDQEFYSPHGTYYTTAEPIPSSEYNAGLGWNVTLGRYKPITAFPQASVPFYTQPDGTEREFQSTTTSGLWYTKDGSYLRMRLLADSRREIDFPDGTTHRFSATTGRLDQIRDRFGNFLNVEDFGTSWRLTDSTGRVHNVYFRTSAPGVGQVDRLVLAGFNGTTSTYTFTYKDTSIQRHPRDGHPGTSTNVTVPLLERVTLPDGSSYYASYYTTWTSNVGSPGLIERLALPTLGGYRWTWRQYSFDLDPARNYEEYDAIVESDGVGSKQMVDAIGVAVGQPWTYLQGGGVVDAANQICEAVTRVTSPEGNETVYYFNAWPEAWDYGLPYTRRLKDATGKRFLSQEIYQGSSTAGTKKRSVYLRYDADDPVHWSNLTYSNRRELNRRVASQRTVFHDDGGRYADEDSSDYDGLGHYRWTTTGGNFNSANVRQQGTNYNVGRGTYAYDIETRAYTAAHTFTAPPALTEPWLLETFTWQRSVEGTATQTVTSCFNSTNGFLERRRAHRLNGTGESANDVLAVFTQANGNVVREEWYGGDTQSLTANGTTCTMALPTSQYRIDHSYQYGSLASSQHKTAAGGATGSLAFKSLDLDVDLNTGLARVSRDTAGIATTYEYDGLGRQTWEMPVAGHGAWVETLYTRAEIAFNVPYTMHQNRRANGGKTAAVLDQSETLFDRFGRVWQERELMPGGVWATRETLYNNSGWTTSVSSWQSGTPTKKTTFSGYDPFGRPGTITPPDGSGHNVTISYAGERSVTRTVKIGGSRDVNGNIVESGAATTELYDRQGRLWRVTEPSGAGGASVTTEYGWVVSNKLGSVKTTGAEGIQNRWMTWDNRGFLLSETLPERTVTYSNYDSRGHAGRLRDGVNDITYGYDRAERMTQARETGGLLRPLKTFVYGSGLINGDRSAGKVVQATRHNYPTLGGITYDTPVTYAYTYGGAGGAVSSRSLTMTFNGAPSTSFTQSFVYDALGNPTSQAYPQCTFADCLGVATPRTVSYTWSNGLLTAVPGYATSITYHPNGMLNKITHSNGVADTWGLDLNSMTRPASITTSGADVNWVSGTHSYDGAGNLVKVGTAWYLYDKVGRVTTGTVFDLPGGGGTQKQQSYTYDSFGNLTAIGGTSGRNVPVNSLTNRLTGTAVYDLAGNLTAWNGAVYEYDAFDQMKRMVNGGEEWLYMYDADDRRVWQFRAGSTRFDRWILYDLSGRLLRMYEASGYVWNTAPTDYIHRGDRLVATQSATGRRHFHVDHLGTPRLITNSLAQKVAYHVYYPFGEEATAFNQDAERLKLTGHERDLASLASPADDLDAMHARTYHPLLGRFTSVDPAGDHELEVPQSWNRYSYVRNDPMGGTDPDGQVLDTILDIGFVAYDLYDIGRSLWKGEGVSGTQFLALGADVAGVFIPFGTGGGLAVRAVAKVDNVRLTSIAGRLDNAFKNHLNARHARDAAIESLGGVVSRKASGVPFDHFTEFREARRGVINQIEELKSMVGDARLSAAERQEAQRLLSNASKQLDEIERLFNKEVEDFRMRMAVRGTVLQ